MHYKLDFVRWLSGEKYIVEQLQEGLQQTSYILQAQYKTEQMKPFSPLHQQNLS